MIIRVPVLQSDAIAADCGFWDAPLIPLDELRRRYAIPAVADELLA
jgi:hypothetical protein